MTLVDQVGYAVTPAATGEVVADLRIPGIFAKALARRHSARAGTEPPVLLHVCEFGSARTHNVTETHLQPFGRPRNLPTSAACSGGGSEIRPHPLRLADLQYLGPFAPEFDECRKAHVIGRVPS